MKKAQIGLILFLAFWLCNSYAQEYTGNNPDVLQVNKLHKNDQFFKALEICNRAINLAGKKNDTQNLALFTSLKGFIYLDTINQDSALMFFDFSFRKGLSVMDYHSIYYSLYGLGKYYYRNSNFTLSNKYFYLLSYYAEKQKNKYYQLVACYYLSANYNLLMSTSRAMHYARLASQLALELKDTTSYIKSLISIGGRHLLLENSDPLNKNFDSSDYYFNLSEQFYNQFSAKKKGLGSDIYNGLLRSNLEKRNYDKAIYYGKLAIADASNSTYEQNLNVFYDNISMAFTDKKQYDSAIYYLEKAMVLAKKHNYVDEYKMDLKELSRIYRLTGKNEKAFEYLDKYMRADSMYRTDNSPLIDSLKTAFEAEKNALTIKAEKEKIEDRYEQKQKYYTLTVTIIVLLILMLIYILYSRYKFKKEKEKQELFVQIKESEIKALQAQINPHFIFNSLNSILEFIRKSEKEQAAAYLVKFTKLIRMVLEYSDKKNILLKDEIELLKLYAELENFRFNNNFVCKITTSPGLDIYSTEIPSMITQPFIENAVLHGLQNKYSLLNEQGIKFIGELSIHFEEQDEYVKCTIEDNGIGREKAEEIKKAKLMSHQSMGMRITKDRLNLLSQNKCKIDFIDLKNEKGEAAGTRAEILIPITNDF
ncbi:MAG: histidine kinase [Bacteroidia bacterium]|nr:histidine kinase [Bacteroidia bacterium]